MGDRILTAADAKELLRGAPESIQIVPESMPEVSTARDGSSYISYRRPTTFKLIVLCEHGIGEAMALLAMARDLAEAVIRLEAERDAALARSSGGVPRG